MHIPRSSLLCLLAFAACSDHPRPAPAATTGDLRITADNARDVASAAYRVAFDPVRVARIVGSIFDAAPPTSGAGPTGALTKEVEGPEGGTAVVTWQDRDGDDRYSSGDAFTIACADFAAEGLVLTGAATFTDLQVSGTVPTGLTWKLGARLDLLGLRLAAGERTAILSGAYHWERELRATVRLLSLEALGAASVGVRTLADASGAARNDYVLDFTMGLFAVGSLVDPELGGTLVFRTEAPLTGIQVMPDPVNGRLVVEGAGGTSLVVQPLDFFTLEIQVDEDGDGEPDVVLPAEWTEI